MSAQCLDEEEHARGEPAEKGSGWTPPQRRMWTAHEDALLSAAVVEFGVGKWDRIAAVVKSRKDWQCCERWRNQLSPKISKLPWRADEDAAIMQYVAQHGQKWSRVAKVLQGRTGNGIKNRYHILARRDRKAGGDDGGSISDAGVSVGPHCGYNSADFTPSPVARMWRPPPAACGAVLLSIQPSGTATPIVGTPIIPRLAQLGAHGLAVGNPSGCFAHANPLGCHPSGLPTLEHSAGQVPGFSSAADFYNAAAMLGSDFQQRIVELQHPGASSDLSRFLDERVRAGIATPPLPRLAARPAHFSSSTPPLPVQALAATAVKAPGQCAMASGGYSDLASGPQASDLAALSAELSESIWGWQLSAGDPFSPVCAFRSGDSNSGSGACLGSDGGGYGGYGGDGAGTGQPLFAAGEPQHELPLFASPLFMGWPPASAAPPVGACLPHGAATAAHPVPHTQQQGCMPVLLPGPAPVAEEEDVESLADSAYIAQLLGIAQIASMTALPSPHGQIPNPFDGFFTVRERDRLKHLLGGRLKIYSLLDTTPLFNKAALVDASLRLVSMLSKAQTVELPSVAL